MDEYLLGEDLAKTLRSRGAYVVGPVTELRQAMAVAHNSFDVAVIDINLRGYCAYPLADKLMSTGKPFIFTTGYAVEVVPHRFRHVQRWEKPYDLEIVVAHVAELCARPPLLAV